MAATRRSGVGGRCSRQCRACSSKGTAAWQAKRPRLAAAACRLSPRPLADSDRIQQVLFNLLDNALRHTDSGGHIRVSATGKGGWVMVSVCNDGHGLDPAAIPLVFERFYKHGSSGRGLGLAIVRSIVRAHGGDVGAESVPERETTFWFTLPVSGCDARRGSAQAPASLG